MGPCLFRHANAAGAALMYALLSVGSAAAGADEPRATLMRRAHDVIERGEKCAANARTANQRLFEAFRKPYLSAEDRQKDWERLDRALEAERACAEQAAAELQKALPALEIQCQKDLDEVQARPGQAPRERAGLEKARDDLVTCVNWARSQRLQRERLEELKIMEAGCEREARDTAEFMKRDVARPSYTREGGTRTYQDQARDLEMFERERRQHLACADAARTRQAQIRLALDTNPGSRATFERELGALLRGLQHVAAELNDRKTLRYEEFTTRMARFRPEMDAFKTRHARFLADKEGQPLAGKLLEAGELIVRSAETWQRAAGVQDVARREAILREVGAQWQAFQNLVREASAQAAPSERK